MFIGLKATFEKLTDAKNAYNEVETKLDGSKADIKFNDLEHTQDRSSGKMSFTKMTRSMFYGLILGATLGYIVFAIVGANINFTPVGWNIFSIVSPFAVIGAISGSILYFVSRERAIRLSEKDVKGDKAVITIACDKKNLTLVEKIMNKYHADQVFVS